MWKIKNLLFPLDLDFTEGNEKMMFYLQGIAEMHKAKIHLLHILPDPSEYYGYYAINMNFSELAQSMHQNALEKMEELVASSILSAMKVECHVISGRPATEIVDFATSKQMDLILMGTHGRKGLEETFFGSVVRQVIKRSPVPVLTVNPLRH